MSHALTHRHGDEYAFTYLLVYDVITRMFNGRFPEEHGLTWVCSFDSNPLLNAADQIVKLTKPRLETCLNLLGCPKLANRSQLLVGRRSPYCLYSTCGGDIAV